MSKLHDTYLSLKKVETEEDTSYYFSSAFWDDIMETISNMGYSLASAKSPDWHIIYINPYILFINKENPQICKCQKAAITRDHENNIETITFTKEITDCDELRCPPKYDNTLMELSYVLENQHGKPTSI